jgi:hypothetical protein
MSSRRTSLLLAAIFAALRRLLPLAAVLVALAVLLLSVL